MKFKNIKNLLVFFWIMMLTFIAGMTNIFTVKTFSASTSHQTGNITNLAINIYDDKAFNSILFLTIFLFFCGAVISGFLFHEKNLGLQRKYGIAIILCGIIINLISLIKNNDLAILCILTLIVGFQNGLFIKSNGILIRTTHFTGYLTDAGFLLGSVIRGHFKDAKAIAMYFILIIFFILGGILSAYCVDFKKQTLIIIGCAYIICGLYYFLLRKTIPKIENKFNKEDNKNIQNK